MTGVRSVFTQRELEFMKASIGVEFSDAKDYSDEELDGLYWFIMEELPCGFDDDGYPLESGRLFLSIMDKFYEMDRKKDPLIR